MKSPDEQSGRRPRRRPAGAEVSHAVFDRTRTYRHLSNPFEPMKVFSDDHVAAIHDAALVILETQGMKVLSGDARTLYRGAGAEVDETTQIVRLDRALVGNALATAPRQITLHALDPQRHVPMFGRHVAFAPTSGPPNIMDTARGRRAGTLEDFCNVVKHSATNIRVAHLSSAKLDTDSHPISFS